ncbi:Yig1p Ecym_2207 [Eremothecium cymbalariae DBVPG|uniref:Anaphase-promoting complex subunit 4 WD40 domain-containing protein n=1 Tax=Eremothecium cymbalariae (strain CBS 270.75 / DBVPG 7215 / KCTC 17166 / NRRL Y-17582) TaxID=931890 RepID=G8JP51_ERECY|nr:Hypothetical protein Ecym_2207 [Eremothecium cymbalariae DBVPG\
MGIPVALYTSGVLVVHERVVASRNGGARQRSRGQECSTIDDKVRCEQWSLRRTASVANSGYGRGSRSYQMGSYWCLWDEDGGRCMVVDAVEAPRVVDLSFAALSAGEKISCVIVIEDGEGLVCGTSQGRLLKIALANDSVLQETRLSEHPVDYIWHDDHAGGYVVLTSRDSTVYQFAQWGSAMSLSQYKIQLPGEVVGASLSADGQYLCVADRRKIHFYRWEMRATPFRSMVVCQDQVDDDGITRIAWDRAGRMVLVCTTGRVMCYDTRDHWISVVARQPHKLVEWSPVGNLFLVGQHRYGTLLSVYEHNDRGHWSSLGYTDIATKFGISRVEQMAVMKNQVHLLHSDCYESFAME